jgi:hypothetical protein
MKSNLTAIIKISLFLFLGILFGGSLIVYSESRSGHSVDVSVAESEHAVVVNGSSDDSNRKYEKLFTVSDGGKVIVDAEAGTIEIKSWERKEVRIVVEVDGSDSRVNKYTVQFKQEGNTVTVTGKVRDNSFFKWHVGNLDARYTIFTPKEFSAEVNTSGGDVDVADLNGKMDIETSGGNIVLENIIGEVIASTSGGDIETTNITGPVNAETSGGSIRSSSVKGSFDGHTSGGDVVIDRIDGRVKASTSGGNIRAKIDGENKGIHLETSGGDIDIYLKENIAADIDAETTGGEVDCDLPVVVKGKVKESELHGKINGGGESIYAQTSGGSIRIAELK